MSLAINIGAELSKIESQAWICCDYGAINCSKFSIKLYTDLLYMSTPNLHSSTTFCSDVNHDRLWYICIFEYLWFKLVFVFWSCVHIKGEISFQTYLWFFFLVQRQCSLRMMRLSVRVGFIFKDVLMLIHVRNTFFWLFSRVFSFINLIYHAPALPPLWNIYISNPF